MTDAIPKTAERFDLQQPDNHMGLACMQAEPYGDYVRHSDYAALSAQLEAANARLDDYRHESYTMAGLLEQANSKLEAANQRHDATIPFDALAVAIPDDEPRQIVCTGEEGSDVWQPAFGTWSYDDFGIYSDETIGAGERLFVNRRIYNALLFDRNTSLEAVARARDDALNDAAHVYLHGSGADSWDFSLCAYEAIRDLRTQPCGAKSAENATQTVSVQAVPMTIGCDLSTGGDESAVWIKNPTPEIIAVLHAIAGGKP
jgi:hypothetical protein